MTKPNCIIRIPAELNVDFFKKWLLFTKPMHNLTNKETDVLAAFLNERYKLSKVITDEDLLDKITLGEDNKRKIREQLKISYAYFQCVMTKFRAAGIIVNNKFSLKLVPKINEGTKAFQLVILFDLND